MAWDLSVLKTPDEILSNQCKSCSPSSCWEDKEVYNLHITRGKEEVYLPPVVGKAGFCKLQKLICFIMEMITLFRSGSDCATTLADTPLVWTGSLAIISCPPSVSKKNQKKPTSLKSKKQSSPQKLYTASNFRSCVSVALLFHTLQKNFILLTFKLPKTELRFR